MSAQAPCTPYCETDIQGRIKAPDFKTSAFTMLLRAVHSCVFMNTSAEEDQMVFRAIECPQTLEMK